MANLVLQPLENCSGVAKADDLVENVWIYETHMAIQFMEVIFFLNTTKCTKTEGGGAPTDGK